MPQNRKRRTPRKFKVNRKAAREFGFNPAAVKPANKKKKTLP